MVWRCTRDESEHEIELVLTESALVLLKMIWSRGGPVVEGVFAFFWCNAGLLVNVVFF